MADSLSVIIPVFNEAANIELLYDELVTVLARLPRDFEILFVDDGSTDNSPKTLERLARRDARVKVVTFQNNSGQSAAMSAGIEFSRNEVIVFLDADLQNDPADIPMLLDYVDAGYDLVHGWRKHRQDKLVSRKIPSRIANWLISKVCRFRIRDLGCSLKAMRRDVALELELTRGMHRFIPILAAARGARCREVPVNHRERTYGESKYGIGRVFKVIPDLIVVRFLTRSAQRPMQFFGVIGMVFAIAAVVTGGLVIVMKQFTGHSVGANPWFYVTVSALILSLQAFGLGALGEIGMRHYDAEAGRKPYAIRLTLNVNPETPVPSIPLRRAA